MDHEQMQMARHRRDSRDVLRRLDSARRIQRDMASAELINMMRRCGIA